MHLLYITFGKKFTTHLQAAFSICSFLRAPESISSINVITDAPEFYAHLKERIRIVPVDAATLKEWEGPHQFFWRIKIKAIQQVCAQYAGQPVLYLDTDTFFYKSAKELAALFAGGNALMHENEGPLSAAPTKTEKRMWQQVQGRTYDGFALPAGAAMWNAGVVGVPNTTGGAECSFALNLCDQMCAEGVTRRLIEQFALSVALERYYGLVAAHPLIAHYWSNKEAWDQRINQLFSEAFFKGLSLDQVIAQVNDFDFKTLPVKKYQKNTAVRLHKLVDGWFPPKSVAFIEGGK